MQRDEFKILVKAMKAVYSDPKFIPDADAFSVWFEFFKDDDYMVVQAAIQKYIANNTFQPTVADIRKYLTQITAPENDMPEQYAWALVYKAICNSNYSAKDEFDKLPDVCKKAVGTPDNLREWAMLSTDEVNTVIQSNFLKGFRVAKKQEAELASLPCQMREKIESIAAAHTPLISKGGYIDD
jgi:hypothetical protein